MALLSFAYREGPLDRPDSISYRGRCPLRQKRSQALANALRFTKLGVCRGRPSKKFIQISVILTYDSSCV